MKNPFIKKFVRAIIIFGIIDAFILTGAIWMAGKINKTEGAIKQFVASSENKSFRTQELRAALDKIRKTRQEVEGYDNYLFKTGEELNLIRDLEAIADKNHVSLQIVNSNLDQIVNNKINLNLIVSGNYRDAVNYLLDLETHSYFLSVESVDLAPNVSPALYSPESTVRLNIILSIYAG